jgi:hypothetical protein
VAKAMRRQLRNARMLNVKSDETIAVEEVAPEATKASTGAPSSETVPRRNKKKLLRHKKTNRVVHSVFLKNYW